MSAPTPASCEETSVVICGGGPTGVLLSSMLALRRVPNIVLEREPEITTDPRGIVLDEDGIRMLQSVGIYDKIFTEIGSCMGKFYFITGTGTDLAKKPLFSLDYSTSEGGTGHVGVMCHKQPALEKAVRDVMANNQFSHLRTGSTLQSIEEDEDWVYVQYTNTEGQLKRLKARFLVGSDGKTGYVRKKYLEPKGVVMERCEGTSYEEVWVALNWQISLPNEKTHPNFPLWNLGYTPEEVYQLFFPHEFRFLCNPDRPAVCGHFGLPQDRLWRFEFLVKRNEDGSNMATQEETSKIIYPYITHPGNRYGLRQAVRYPEDCIKTLRSRPFSFSARSCNKWALGRVAIAGDAAHVFPPFGGQGISSGFRDASALSWRLALFHREPRADHQKLLTGWYLERKQQLERSLAVTIRNGDAVNESNWVKFFIREWYLWAVQLIPSWRRQIEKGSRALGMTQYQHQKDLPFLPDMQGGLQLAQVYVWSFDTSRVAFSDDLIFAPSKQGLLQILLLPETVEEADILYEMIEGVTERSGGLVVSDEATCLIQDRFVQQSVHTKHASMARLASGEDFAADSRLCRNRPPPKHYDPYLIKRQVKRGKIVIVRHDRFVFAVCSTRRELLHAVKTLPLALSVPGRW